MNLYKKDKKVKEQLIELDKKSKDLLIEIEELKEFDECKTRDDIIIFINENPWWFFLNGYTYLEDEIKKYSDKFKEELSKLISDEYEIKGHLYSFSIVNKESKIEFEIDFESRQVYTHDYLIYEKMVRVVKEGKKYPELISELNKVNENITHLKSNVIMLSPFIKRINEDKLIILEAKEKDLIDKINKMLNIDVPIKNKEEIQKGQRLFRDIVKAKSETDLFFGIELFNLKNCIEILEMKDSVWKY